MLTDSKDSGTGSSEDGERGPSAAHRLDLLHGGVGSVGVVGVNERDRDWSESRADSGPDSPECLYEQREPPRHHPLHHQMHHPAFMTSSPHHHRLTSSPASTSTSGGTTSATTKPRIWSLADMASKDGDSTSPNPAASILGSPYATSNNGSGGKIVSPLASRLPPHHPLHPAMHPASQFVRPHPDFYRNFYAAPHLAAGDMSLLETYQRTFGVMPPTSAPSLLASSSAGIPKAFNGSSSVASTHPVLSTVSPSSSSASSNGSPNPGLAELKSPGRV